jgi:HEAT repeat protein
MPLGGRALLLLPLLLAACSARDPLKQLLSELDDPTGREEAIHGLVQLTQKTPAPGRVELQQKVVTALMAAYREDESRPEIVTALATLRDPRAEPVFVAALGDAPRSGSYFEAAVHAARVIGELKLKQSVPELIKTLRKAIASPREDRNAWLERAIVHSLITIGDPRALEVLVEVLQGDPSRQDFYLNKMAASALGELGGTKAIRPLVRSLSSSQHGLLLFEESRQALCRIGPATLPELLAAASRRDARGQPAENAGAALRVLADIAEPGTVPQLAGMARDKDALEYRLAVAEAQIRSRSVEGEKTLLGVLRDKDAALTGRRRAAELLGWYGSRATASALLAAACEGTGAAQAVLCWSGALAFTRVAGHEGLDTLDALARNRKDAATRRYLNEYRPRLELLRRCAGVAECLTTALQTSADWREQERAALELGRTASTASGDTDRADRAPVLARAFGVAHPQVQEAILVALERLGPTTGRAGEVADKLRSVSSGASTVRPPPAIASRALCASQAWRRRSGERR